MQDLKIALFLSFKSTVRSNIAVSILMIFILSLAFINLIFISSILNGVLEAINKQIVTNVVSNIIIDPEEEPTKKDFINHSRELQQDVETIPGVVATAAHYKLAGTFAYDKEKNGKFKYISGQIIGIDPDEERKISNVSNKIANGVYLEKGDEGKILLGAELAGGYEGTAEFTNLGGVKVGETVSLTYTNGEKRDYKVKGIFFTKFDTVDRIAFVSRKEAQSILSMHNNASQILVRIDKSGAEDAYLEKIRSIKPNLKVRKWTDYMGPMKGISKSFDVIILIITTIGILVAAITIFILIYVNVVHKRRQIGILKAIGVKQRIIIYSYLFQALFYATFGVLSGTLLTMFLIVPYFASHPLDLAIGDVSLSLNIDRITYGATSLLSAALVAGFIPSWRAARENILKAIWGA